MRAMSGSLGDLWAIDRRQPSVFVLLLLQNLSYRRSGTAILRAGLFIAIFCGYDFGPQQLHRVAGTCRSDVFG